MGRAFRPLAIMVALTCTLTAAVTLLLGFYSDKPLHVPSRTSVARRTSPTKQRAFQLPSDGEDWHDGSVVCVLDVELETIPLFLNCAISMAPLCRHLLAVTWDERVIAPLQDHKIPVVFSAQLLHQELKTFGKGGSCSQSQRVLLCLLPLLCS
jgi:hypothetical protein